MVTGMVCSWPSPLNLASGSPVPLGLCPSIRKLAFSQMSEFLCFELHWQPQQPDSSLNHPAPQKEDRMGWGLEPGCLYMFLKSIRDTDVGSQVTGSKSVIFSFFSPTCAGMSQPPRMESLGRGSGSLSHSLSGWQRVAARGSVPF